MAYANVNTGYGYHPAPAHGAISGRRPSYPYEADDDSAILDSAILDHADMQSPADAQPRKGSYAPTNGIFTPVESQGWNPAYGGLPVEPPSAHIFHDDRHGFAARAPLHVSTFVPQPQSGSWGYEHRSGHCTPTNGANLEYLQQAPAGYEQAQYIHHRNDSARGSFNHGPPSSPHAHPPQHFNNPRPDGTFAPAPQVQTPMSPHTLLSPHSQQDWMALAQQESENRRTKRMRSRTPGQTSVDVQRRDGIRKKNSRIDIPHERNSDTIDRMIEQTEDEDLLKELKQQKRLLRNREAALASRQRKKRHTEELEGKEKNFQSQVNTMQLHMDRLGQQLRDREQHMEVLMDQLRALKHHNEILEEEKRAMNMRHAEESGTLRKRLQLLNEQLEAGPAPGMSAQPSSAGFNDFTGEMEALNMGGTQEWDNFDIFSEFNSNITDDFAFDTNPDTASPSLLDKRSTPTTLATASEKKSTETSADPPIASGFLFFLLLCGAFVASKPASSRPSYIPQVPEDVQAAAPALINNLLSDPGATLSTQQPRHTGRSAMEPAQSGHPQTTRPRNRLDQVHQRITSPTKEQEAAAAFSLTTQQYASISGMDYLAQNEQSEPMRHNTPNGHRRVLAETLTKMENERARNHKADVYSRSLLWDQIPADVLRQFREMAHDHNELEERQNQMTHDEMETFKVEQG